MRKGYAFAAKYFKPKENWTILLQTRVNLQGQGQLVRKNDMFPLQKKTHPKQSERLVSLKLFAHVKDK